MREGCGVGGDGGGGVCRVYVFAYAYGVNGNAIKSSKSNVFLRFGTVRDGVPCFNPAQRES